MGGGGRVQKTNLPFAAKYSDKRMSLRYPRLGASDLVNLTNMEDCPLKFERILNLLGVVGGFNFAVGLAISLGGNGTESPA